jgi:hypothetical protein
VYLDLFCADAEDGDKGFETHSVPLVARRRGLEIVLSGKGSRAASTVDLQPGSPFLLLDFMQIDQSSHVRFLRASVHPLKGCAYLLSLDASDSIVAPHLTGAWRLLRDSAWFPLVSLPRGRF